MEMVWNAANAHRKQRKGPVSSFAMGLQEEECERENRYHFLQCHSRKDIRSVLDLVGSPLLPCKCSSEATPRLHHARLHSDPATDPSPRSSVLRVFQSQ